MPTPATRLIVNADDYGLSPGVSAGILAAHRQGILTSTTYMVNWPWSPEAAAELQEVPGLGVGLHLNLTAGPPVLPPERVPSLVDGHGRFHRRGARYLLAGARPAEVELEWGAQVERFRQFMGRLPTHLDTHHYVHTVPRLAAVLIRVAQRFGIRAARAVRPGDYLRHPAPMHEWVGRLLLSQLALGSAAMLAASGLRCPDRTVMGPWSAAWLERRLRGLPPGGTYEVVVHPGYVDEQVRRLSSLRQERQVELDALCRPEVRGAVQAAGANLIHFGHL